MFVMSCLTFVVWCVMCIDRCMLLGGWWLILFRLMYVARCDLFAVSCLLCVFPVASCHVLVAR